LVIDEGSQAVEPVAQQADVGLLCFDEDRVPVGEVLVDSNDADVLSAFGCSQGEKYGSCEEESDEETFEVYGFHEIRRLNTGALVKSLIFTPQLSRRQDFRFRSEGQGGGHEVPKLLSLSIRAKAFVVLVHEGFRVPGCNFAKKIGKVDKFESCQRGSDRSRCRPILGMRRDSSAGRATHS
jgi:hypothetical protein